MQVWQPRTVVKGGSRWVEREQGRWVDLGKLDGPELVKWCFMNRVPLPGYSSMQDGRQVSKSSKEVGR